jgi:hypothetical protein
VNFAIEDGTNMPRTSLGKRAAIEQANADDAPESERPGPEVCPARELRPDGPRSLLEYRTCRRPSQIQDQFEKWAQNPVGPSPLQIKPWYNLEIHLNERIKWLNTDRMREILAANPALEMIVTQHLQQLQMLLAPPPMPGPGGPGGPTPGAPGAPGIPNPAASREVAGWPMNNSNSHSGRAGSQPHGNAQMGPNVGPA